MINTLEEDINNSFLPKVIFGFSESWEIRNWYETCIKESRFGISTGSNKWDLGDMPLEVAQIIEKEKGIEQEKMLDKIKPVFSEFIQRQEIIELKLKCINNAEKNWHRIASDYFAALSKMLNISINDFKKEYYAYFTFSKRCPFGEDRFMFNRFLDISNIAAHEIMHIEFLRKYKDYCKNKGLSDIKIDHLKEILSVLLNEDMKNILFRPDGGYPKHQEIRSKILEIYQKNKKENKKFIQFLDEAIDVVKEASF
ncbi:MAG TPA: hypothetical protein PKL20_02835 [Candidatus Paceibacterota bacterium]|nr:hypothetical protein [Candidatus Paceibacterota bacterium]